MTNLPHNPEAERAIVGAILLRPAVIDRVAGLKPEDFVHPGLGAAFRAALELDHEGKPVDVITLEAALSARGELERAGGFAGLTELTEGVVTAENVSYYARLVADAAARRRVIQVTLDIAGRARSGEASADQVIQEALGALDKCAGPAEGGIVISDLLDRVWEEVQTPPDRRKPDGVTTGLKALDSQLTCGGYPRRQTTIVAGATSAGKSALATTGVIAAARAGMGVLCCSFEDEPITVVKRALAQLARIPNRQVQRSLIGGGEERDRFRAAVAELARGRVAFLERTPPTITELTATIRRHVQKHSTDLVVIDFLQLLKSGMKQRSRQDEVDAVFGEIVAMARTLPAATVVVSQLHRTKDRPPSKEDLYHSGALEQWSHTIALLWRPELPGFPQMVSLRLAKQKNGPTGWVALGWNPDLVSYLDPDPFEAQRYNDAVKRFVEKEAGRRGGES